MWKGKGGEVGGGGGEGGLSSKVIMQSMQTLKMINTTTRLVSDIVTTSSCGKITSMQQTGGTGKQTKVLRVNRSNST